MLYVIISKFSCCSPWLTLLFFIFYFWPFFDLFMASAYFKCFWICLNFQQKPSRCFGIWRSLRRNVTEDMVISSALRPPNIQPRYWSLGSVQRRLRCLLSQGWRWMVRATLRSPRTIETFQSLRATIQKWCRCDSCIWGFKKARVNSVSHNWFKPYIYKKWKDGSQQRYKLN